MNVCVRREGARERERERETKEVNEEQVLQATSVTSQGVTVRQRNAFLQPAPERVNGETNGRLCSESRERERERGRRSEAHEETERSQSERVVGRT